MSFSAGDTLGPYEILEPLGQGGMGEVYRARDPRVGREVAVKASRAQFSERFEREVRAIAALNHPHICTLFDVGPNYLVMELVEGETLAARLTQGPIPLDEALGIARQVAEALEAAHEKGIVHRDLKPGNVMLKPDGSVKVLDFGLAKHGPAGGEGAGAGPDESPTLSMAATQAGIVLGTAAYMAPEQARGKAVDKRADIWAFGVLLYEMVAGWRPFQGEDLTETLASVVKVEPDFAAAPVRLRRLLARCLVKDPRHRLRDIGDVWDLLADEGSAGAAPAPKPGIAATLWPAAAAVLLAATAALAYLQFGRTSEPASTVRFSVSPPAESVFSADMPTVSPDGRRVAAAVARSGQSSLWVRDLDALEGRVLPGTEGARYPFWSPDGRFLAFFANGMLKKIDLAGGPPLSLADSLSIGPGAWNEDGVILFTPGVGGLSRVSASGGPPSPVTTADPASEFIHQAPAFLPGGRRFLYFSVSTVGRPGVFVAALDSTEQRRVLDGSTHAVYVPSITGTPGSLLFVRDQTLMAQPFDPSTAELSGDPVPVAQPVDHPANAPPRFSASRNGALVYLSGVAGSAKQLTWFDQAGTPSGTVGPPHDDPSWPAISPDGLRVASARNLAGAPPDIWVTDLVRGGESRLTFGPTNLFPVWSPDGASMAFTSVREGDVGILRRPTSGGAEDEFLDRSNVAMRPLDWSRDGQYLIEGRAGEQGDIWVLPLASDGSPQDGADKAFAYVDTEFDENFAKLSPNGQWLAYESDESRQREVYVQTFPNKGGKWQVSIGGGRAPIWSRDGRELYFVSADQRMMAVEIRGGADFDRGSPRALFSVNLPEGVWFDVHEDGRFLIPVPAAQSSAAPMTVILNWQAGRRD